MFLPKTIRLCYRKRIDAQASKPWDKLVFEDTYAEFLLQAQLYNQQKQFRSFGDLINHVPQAERLHFLVSAAVIGYLKQLNGKVPDVRTIALARYHRQPVVIINTRQYRKRRAVDGATGIAAFCKYLFVTI